MKSSIILFISISLPLLIAADNTNSYGPLDYIAISCGSSLNLNSSSGKWIGDQDSNMRFHLHPSYSSSISNSLPNQISLPPEPYSSVRFSRFNFTYILAVTPGPKFIRLHFRAAEYTNFSPDQSFFTVQAGPYVLLDNFSAYLYADHFNKAPSGFFREFFVTIPTEQKMLNLTFAPTPGIPDAYAFVNGIEVVSMPDNLYYNASLDVDGIQFVGQKTPIWLVETSDALELVKRLNVGGADVEAISDTGMWRRWESDESYITSENLGVIPANLTIDLNYTKVPNCTAPDVVYKTARSMGTNKTINLNYNLTWSFEVDSNFYYLVRLHFCEFQKEINNPTDRVFRIYIDSVLAEIRFDVIELAGGKGVPIFRDYAVAMYGSEKKTRNLSVALHALPDGYTLYSDALLNGLELFKISQDGNLAGPNPDPILKPQGSPTQGSSSNVHSKKIASSNGHSKKIAIIAGIASGLGVLSVVAFLLHRQGTRVKDSSYTNRTSWWGLYSVVTTTESTKTQQPSLRLDLCQHFSLVEIKAATNNFHEVFIIGVGGFGNVYKGSLDGGSKQVAIKRLNPGSQQGAHEFTTEIQMLSQLRHLHLVSLIGYCNDAGEMILVYDYMARGTLRDHLYDTQNPPISWKQRLVICIGVARGLRYLHTGAKHAIIHRDMKTTNILLDEKWVAKVSDFGLSKIGPTSLSKAHVSTAVKGTFGYLDPEYYRRLQLTEKSDVYSFGVVLLEVLCARPAVNRTAEMEQISLAWWAQSCYKSGTIERILDPHLKGAITPDCLKKFCDIAMSCLNEEGAKRPSMNDVVWGLEFALRLQESAERDVMEEKDDGVGFLMRGNVMEESEVASTATTSIVTTRRESGELSVGSTSSYGAGMRPSKGAAFSATMDPDEPLYLDTVGS